MHNLGPSQLEHAGMYQETFEGPYETAYSGESPLHEIFAHEAPTHEYHEHSALEGGYHEMPSHEMHEAHYEMGHEFGQGEAGLHEFHGESPLSEEFAGEDELNEEEELSLTAELLEIQSEEELDRFLGKLLKRAVRGAGSFIRSPAGKLLGNVLRQVARRALPIAGKAVGTFFGGPLGGMVAGQLTGMATQAMGLETEGMSEVDAEFASARQFIRFGTEAARRAAMGYASSPYAAPQAITQAAFRSAAQQFAPGLLGPSAGRIPLSPLPMGRRRGVWVRRGRTITLYGV